MKEADLIRGDDTKLNNDMVANESELEIGREIKAYRLKFNKILEPIKAMLVNRKQELTAPEWLRFVEMTRKSVICNPDQYLGTDLPPQGAMISIVEMIFDEFLEQRN